MRAGWDVGGYTLLQATTTATATAAGRTFRKSERGGARVSECVLETIQMQLGRTHVLVLEASENFDLSQRALAEGLMLEGRNLLDRHALSALRVQGGAEMGGIRGS